jgi:hypothetical protein
VSPQSGQLAPRALAYAVKCHAGHRRVSDGEPFIKHPLEVARLLRDAGCAEHVIAAGLLHDVVEDSLVDLADLAEEFGDKVARVVEGVTADGCVDGYRQRKQMLRDQVRFVGGDVALLFAADSISKVREWPRRVGRERARLHELAPDSRARRFLEHQHEMRLEHYAATLTMLERVLPGHRLVEQLAQALDRCSTADAPLL